jgi:hypothetical protein
MLAGAVFVTAVALSAVAGQAIAALPPLDLISKADPNQTSATAGGANDSAGKPTRF